MKKILFTSAELSTRFAAERGAEPTRQVIPAGTHLTDALLKKHGLKAEDVRALLDRGHIVERMAHVVSEAGDSPTALEVAAADARAADAESALASATAEIENLTAKVADLESQVAALTEQLVSAKPATPAKA